MVGHCEFTYVVEERASLQGFDIAIAESEHVTDTDRIDLCSPNVADADLVASVDCSGEGFDGCQVETARLHDLFRLLIKTSQVEFVTKISEQRQRYQNEAELNAEVVEHQKEHDRCA